MKKCSMQRNSAGSPTKSRPATCPSPPVSISEYSDSPGRKATNWRALDYECAVIATRTERLSDGKGTVDVESVPVLFAGGEPKAKLSDEAPNRFLPPSAAFLTTPIPPPHSPGTTPHPGYTAAP